MYLPKTDKEAKKLNDAYRLKTVIKHEGVKVRVVGMTRSIPPRYVLEPDDPKPR